MEPHLDGNGFPFLQPRSSYDENGRPLPDGLKKRG